MKKVTRWKRVGGRMVRDGHDYFPRILRYVFVSKSVYFDPVTQRSYSTRGATYRRGAGVK